MLPLFLILSLIYEDSLAEKNFTASPRMVFTDQEIGGKRWPAPGNQAPVHILLREEPDSVTTVGHTHLYTFDFQRPHTLPEEKLITWQRCVHRGEKDCSYNISLVHERPESDQLFVCGTNGRETLCCDVNLSAQSPACVSSDKLSQIEHRINTFILKEGESSVLVESAESTDLYVTYSGSREYVGIHRFGKDKVGPANHNEEQHYVGLMLSRRRDDPLQDKVIAFYRQKKRDAQLHEDMWTSFVSQVCMADIGGRKNNLQFSWTSQMTARLYCGDSESRQYFPELVDVALVQAERWQDTRVYGLFRNEWHMTAVCVYSLGDIDHIFTTSPFIHNQSKRPRSCVKDSTKLSPETLKMIEKTSEMEQWVRPVKESGPLLRSHHNYTRIQADSSSAQEGEESHTVLFLTLDNGVIHKVVHSQSQTFYIAEYRPFNHRAHIVSTVLHPLSKKLYASTTSELLQLDVANCSSYRDSCEECVLSRDPDCGWTPDHYCARVTEESLQDVEMGDHTKCSLQTQASGFLIEDPAPQIVVPSNSMYLLPCPVRSHRAQYTWEHEGQPLPCMSVPGPGCLHVIHRMGPEHQGAYTCVSQEQGYTKVVAQYDLQLESAAAAGPLSAPLIWVCVAAALIKSLC